MALNIQTMHQWFDHFNHLCFNDELPIPQLKLSRSRTRLGSMTYRRSRRYVIFSQQSFTLRISTYYDSTEEELQDVLLHEMIHYYIMLNDLHDTSPHGRLFCGMMDEINRKYHRHITISSKKNVPRLHSTTQGNTARLIVALEMEDGKYFLSVVNPHYAARIRSTIKLVKEIKDSHWFVSNDPYFNDFPAVRSLRARKVSFEVFKQKVECSLLSIPDFVIRQNQGNNEACL